MHQRVICVDQMLDVLLTTILILDNKMLQARGYRMVVPCVLPAGLRMISCGRLAFFSKHGTQHGRQLARELHFIVHQ